MVRAPARWTFTGMQASLGPYNCAVVISVKRRTCDCLGKRKRERKCGRQGSLGKVVFGAVMCVLGRGERGRGAWERGDGNEGTRGNT